MHYELMFEEFSVHVISLIFVEYSSLHLRTISIRSAYNHNVDRLFIANIAQRQVLPREIVFASRK